MLVRPFLLALCSLLLVPASASAAPFTETPLQTLRGETRCVATADPDTLAVTTREGFRLMHASRSGFVAGEAVPLDDPISCSAVALRPNGAGVAVGSPLPFGEDSRTLVASFRDPGGQWSPPAVVASYRESGTRAEVATSDRGDAIIAWLEEHEVSDGIHYRISAVRRAPGASFGSPEVLATSTTREPLANLQVGLTATGEAVVLWTRTDFSRGAPFPSQAEAAVASAARAFAAATRVGPLPWRSTPALAVAADGRALIALPDGKAMFLVERPPGGAFAAPLRIADAEDVIGVRAALAVGDTGEAVVAWRGVAQRGVGVVSRRAPGAFGSPTTVVRPVALKGVDSLSTPETLPAIFLGGFDYLEDTAIGATLAPDRRAVLAWVGYDDDGQRPAMLATVPSEGGAAVTQTAGGAFADVDGALPLILADGTPALAWTDQVSINDGYRLHLAAEGATFGAEPATPRVRVGATDRALKTDAALVLPVTCSGPCDVTARALGNSGARGTLRLKRAGTGRLRLEPSTASIAPRRAGIVRIRVSYGARDARRARVRTISVRLVRAAEAPAPRMLGVRAVRAGNSIRVTWHTDRPTLATAFIATGTATRDWTGEPLTANVATGGRRKTRFRLTLRGAAEVKWVTLRSVTGRFGPRREIVVRVR